MNLYPFCGTFLILCWLSNVSDVPIGESSTQPPDVPLKGSFLEFNQWGDADIPVSVPLSKMRISHQFAHYTEPQDNTSSNLNRGIDYIKNGRLNKGLAFSIQERQIHGILGLLPPAVETIEMQVERCKANLDSFEEDIDKYNYLADLQVENERLFYHLLEVHLEELTPIVYTPVVGTACEQFGLIYQRPRGLFITIHDKENIYDILRNWPEPDVKAIVVTDGERILGLGDLGAHGMGIPIGKLALYTTLAGIKPEYCLPITLDVGTDTQSVLEDKYYIGIKEKRTREDEYTDFLDKFMQAVVARFGEYTLIQFEDFGGENAFKLLEKYRNHYCMFNDDIQGTAAVGVAGILASLRYINKCNGGDKKLSDQVIVFQGAGQASLGIAELCVKVMMEERTSEQDARNKIWLFDKYGLITVDRITDIEDSKDSINKDQIKFAKKKKFSTNSLLEVVKKAKPSILIGASGAKKTFTEEILREMKDLNERPIIFAMSNPTSKAECTAQEAYQFTEGKAIFCSGSPFEPVKYGDKTFYPGQANNAYIFPGVALAVIYAGIRTISDDIFLIAAETLAEQVKDEDFNIGRMFPPMKDIPECSLKIAVKIMEYTFKNDPGILTMYPNPEDKENFFKKQIYDTKYPQSIPQLYEYPTP